MASSPALHGHMECLLGTHGGHQSGLQRSMRCGNAQPSTCSCKLLLHHCSRRPAAAQPPPPPSHLMEKDARRGSWSKNSCTSAGCARAVTPAASSVTPRSCSGGPAGAEYA